MKKVLLGSVVATALLMMSGCGGSDSPKKDDNTTNPPVTKDVTKPTVNSTVSGKPGDALALSKFATDDKGLKSVEISGADKDKFTVNNDGTITLPSTEGTYTITIKAEDKAGNKTASDVTVTVKDSGATPPPANNGDFTVGSQIKVNWSEANSTCSKMSKALPTLAEIKSNKDVIKKAFVDANVTTNDDGNDFTSAVWSSDLDGPTDAFYYIMSNGSKGSVDINSAKDDEHAFVICK